MSLFFFGKKKFDIPSINCATGRDITAGTSSSFEAWLRSERVDEVLVNVRLPDDLTVFSSRQLGQAKSPLGMWFNGGVQHFGWIAVSQKSQKSN